MYDLIVIGAGIVGLATAYRYLERYPERKVAILEKENGVSQHQTGHNSGVIHSGIYYRPGSFRAQMCRIGKASLEAFCEAEEIPFERCGKVIVALNDAERPALHAIYRKGKANGVECRLIDQSELNEIEPHVAGIEAIHVPESGIVDYRLVSTRLAERIRSQGGAIHFNCRVLDLAEREQVIVQTTQGEFKGARVISCAGLYSDRMAGLLPEAAPAAAIVPFRGEYFDLKPAATHLCKGLIYPVPDPRFPFLGVHFTRVITGGVECGPNAVLAFAREGYTYADIDLGDLKEIFQFIGFRRLALTYWPAGLAEFWRSLNKQAFVRALQRLIPEIKADHLIAAPAGVRAQAVLPEGRLLDDFAFANTNRTLHVINAASPAATSSLEVGRYLVQKLDRMG